MSSAEFFAAYPTGLNTPDLRLDMAEGEPFAFMARLAAQADFGPDARIITLDGHAVEFRMAGGWRASNTTPSLTLRFGGRTTTIAMADIRDRFPPATAGLATRFSLTLLISFVSHRCQRSITAWL